MNPIYNLRKNGFKVRVLHQRVVDFPEGEESGKAVIYPRGGFTKVELRDPNGKETFGYSYCSSQDNYCKRTGAQIALGRALKQLEEV